MWFPCVVAGVVVWSRPADEKHKGFAIQLAVNKMIDFKHVVTVDIVFGGDDGWGRDHTVGKC